MIRQYGAQRCRRGDNPLRVGVIPIGGIFYIQEEGWWRDRYRGAPTCRNPWMVIAFLNGTMAATRRNYETGKWEDVYMSGRSDPALVRSLRDGRVQSIAVRTLILHEEQGLTAGPLGHPHHPLNALRPDNLRVAHRPSELSRYSRPGGGHVCKPNCQPSGHPGADIGTRMHADTVTIEVDAAVAVSGLLQQLPTHASACYVMAHGAGAGMTHKFMADVADDLGERGIATLRYQFPFMERAESTSRAPQDQQGRRRGTD